MSNHIAQYIFFLFFLSSYTVVEVFLLSDIVITVEDVALPLAEVSASVSSLLLVPGSVYITATGHYQWGQI